MIFEYLRKYFVLRTFKELDRRNTDNDDSM